MINYGKQFIDNSDILSVKKSLLQPLITSGPNVKDFEIKLKKYLNTKYVVSCSSGTSAIFLSIASLNLKPNSQVIIPAINFVAAANVCKILKVKFHLADVSPNTGQMTLSSVEKILKKIKKSTEVTVLSMYLGGSPENILELSKLKKMYNFKIIEDACHAFGSSYKYKKKITK